MGIYNAVVIRINELLDEKQITANALAYKSGVSQSTIKSILNGESLTPGIVPIKKICDGFEMLINEFFDAPVFYNLNQEIK